jgi:hypothetical protein
MSCRLAGHIDKGTYGHAARHSNMQKYMSTHVHMAGFFETNQAKLVDYIKKKTLMWLGTDRNVVKEHSDVASQVNCALNSWVMWMK